MDGSRFDALTRRGVGLAAGGATALLALARLPGAKAKKKRKRCGKLDDPCNSNKKKCCCGFKCQPEDSTGNFCCRSFDSPCTVTSQDECCTKRCVEGFCLCKTIGQPCSENVNCCSGFCNQTTGQCAEE